MAQRMIVSVPAGMDGERAFFTRTMKFVGLSHRLVRLSHGIDWKERVVFSGNSAKWSRRNHTSQVPHLYQLQNAWNVVALAMIYGQN